MNNSRLSAAILGTLLALGLFLAAGALSNGIVAFKAMDRSVAVKGLAEREVQADLAYWPVSFSVTGNDLKTVHERLTTSLDAVRAFLAANGLGEAETTAATPRITDNSSFNAQPGNRPVDRYRAQAVLTVRTGDVLAVKRAMQKAGDLVSAGVLLDHNYEFQPRFEFTRLNEIKPEMIAQATRNAREAARQFAQDSGSRVGAIRRASQGLFTIADRDPYTPEIKRVRVVTTVDYYLED
ncbi:MAG: SIMPL domain-containing protein [Desulfovibrionaceae bacterium]|jgi:hypothetical protein|nr:SIMPL domain-containing protein [Desulfovibrionaceae bacterium]